MKVKSESEVAQLCLTPSNTMDCSLPGPSIHGIFQAGVLEWGAIASWQPGWEWSLENGYIYVCVAHTCMAEFLLCSPETITVLLISYTPIQNKKLKKMNEI